MKKTFVKLFRGFWSDPLVHDSMTPEDKLFYIYVMSSDRGNLAGCFEVSAKQIAEDLGYSVDAVRVLLQRFEQQYQLIKYDSETNELLVLHYGRYQWTCSPAQYKHLMGLIESIKNPEFKNYIISTYAEIAAAGPKKKAAKPDPAIEAGFEAWWASYPTRRRRDKAKCAQAYIRAFADDETLTVERMQAALDAWKKHPDWTKAGGEYVPMPYTYLNNARYNDIEPSNTLTLAPADGDFVASF